MFHRPSLHGQKGTLGTAKPVISTASSTRKNVVPMKLGTRKPAHVYACPLLAQKVRSLWTVSACALTRTALADSTSIRPPVSACANHTNVHRTTTSTPKRAPASAVSHKERTPAILATTGTTPSAYASALGQSSARPANTWTRIPAPVNAHLNNVASTKSGTRPFASAFVARSYVLTTSSGVAKTANASVLPSSAPSATPGTRTCALVIAFPPSAIPSMAIIIILTRKNANASATKHHKDALQGKSLIPKHASVFVNPMIALQAHSGAASTADAFAHLKSVQLHSTGEPTLTILQIAAASATLTSVLQATTGTRKFATVSVPLQQAILHAVLANSGTASAADAVWLRKTAPMSLNTRSGTPWKALASALRTQSKPARSDFTSTTSRAAVCVLLKLAQLVNTGTLVSVNARRNIASVLSVSTSTLKAGNANVCHSSVCRA